MSRPVQRSGIFLSRVARCRSLCDKHFELTLSLADFPPAIPGQFVQVLCRPPQDAESGAVMLRRPFSIGGLRRGAHGVDMDLLGRVVGAGTAWLATRSPGDSISLLGPLGRGFMSPLSDATALLVAGGIGLPPIRWLAESLANMGVSCTAIVGAQRRSLLPVALIEEPSANGSATNCMEEFSRWGIPAAVTTDDGTCGLRGRVTDAMAEFFRATNARESLCVYACGPEAMLRAVAALCAQQGVVRCELAMERVMGCGMGTCQSCVVPVNDPARAEGWRYALCCTEGPAFDARRVRWDERPIPDRHGSSSSH
jgi:dihydroorotate dehydrogenase electron transfer subunit